MTRTHDSLESEGNDNEQRQLGRRQFLRGTTATVVGVAGLSAISGTVAANATAPSDYPRISTRDHFNDDGDLINGESTFSYDIAGDWSGYNSGEEIAVFVHGWRSSDESDEGIDAAYTAQLALEQNGYDEFNAVFTWDSDKGDSWWDLGWTDAKEIARDNGEKLANFVTDWNDQVGTPVRIIAHSLGALVTVETLESVVEDFGRTDQVTSVSLLGGAIDNDAPARGDDYGRFVRDATAEFDNFYSDRDEVLDTVYELRELDTAVGEEGLEGQPVSNYEDHDVTSLVADHGDYYKPDVGCMGLVVEEF